MPTESSPTFVELTVAPPQSKTNKYTDAERKEHCEAWRKSGLSMNEYCRRSGLLISTFSLWVKRSNSNPEIDLQKRTEKTANHLSHPGVEIILVSGIRLRFAGGVNITEILRLIKALESCS